MQDFKLVKFDTYKLPAFSNLQQLYEAEFSPLMDYDLNEEGKYDQDMLVSHWNSRGYDMYMLYYKDRIPAGFVVVNLGSMLDRGKENTRDIAEFYVLPKFRNTGVGKWMAFEMFTKYPGNWEVRQVAGLKAREFWLKVIREFTGKEVEEVLDHPQWQGTAQKFYIEKIKHIKLLKGNKVRAKSDQIVCVAKLTAKQENLDTLQKIFAELLKEGPKESGCIRYELHQDIENPLIFTFIDRFKDQAAFDDHCAQPHIKKYFDDILPALVEDMDISVHKEVEI